MNIALLNTKITIQKNTVVKDTIGNHTTVWEDYYSCHATISGEKGNEAEKAGTVTDHSGIDFTLRYCSAVSGITSTEYRVLYDDEIYDITGIDHMSNKRKCIKLICRKVRRS